MWKIQKFTFDAIFLRLKTWEKLRSKVEIRIMLSICPGSGVARILLDGLQILVSRDVLEIKKKLKFFLKT
jgi:hypothetical protein